MSAHESLDEAVSSGIKMEPRTGSEGATTLQGPAQSDIKWLDLSRSVIEQKEKKMLARALENNELPNVEVLFLEKNAGDVGMMAMLNALRAGHLKGLKKFILWEVSSYNQITTAEEGTDTIAAALQAGNLPILDTMDFTGSLPKLIPARKLSNAMKELLCSCSCGTGRLLEGLQICMGCMFCTTGPEKNQTLECLRCSCRALQVYSGDDGLTKIAMAFNITPIESLRVLRLQHNHIGDEGASSIAKILRRGKLPHLDELDLRNNPVGYQGAMNIVFAYLKNPLLTVRLKLDWPVSLLQEKAVGFRDSNIRLEYRLKKLKIPRDSIVINQYIKLDYYLKRSNGAVWFQRHSHRLHLLCQAQHGVDSFKSHEVVRAEVEGKKDREPKGIEIRNRSIFGNSSPKQNVRRDVDLDEETHVDKDGFDSDDTNEEANGHGWLSSRVLGHQRPSPQQKKTVLKKTAGVIRIYITSKSCGFLGAAKALGNQVEGRDSQRRRWLPEWLDLRFRRRFWPWQSQRKTKRQMDSIMSEVLMMAERKPDEFYFMFGLRQVLLQNRNCDNKYSRVWICRSCFLGYSASHAVHPITTDDEVGQKVSSHLDQLHQEPEPPPHVGPDVSNQ